MGTGKGMEQGDVYFWLSIFFEGSGAGLGGGEELAGPEM
jgi:hypothetical protein